MRWLVTIGAVFGLAACQNYDFRRISSTPVRVITQVPNLGADAGTAYIMIVQDTSGSMCQPIAASGVSTNQAGCANDPSESKIGLISQDFTQVLEGLDGGAFYIGLTAFPASGKNDCSAPSAPVYPIGPSTTNIPKIVSWYQNATPNGGTPTAASLALAGTDPGLTTAAPGKSRYIILLTDGYPNCSSSNPCATDPAQNQWSDGVAHGCESATYEQLQNHNTATPPSLCQCGNGGCVNPADNMSSDCCFGDLSQNAQNSTAASQECLDSVNTDNTLSALEAQGIFTFVVGVGSGFTNYDVLDAMAQAGSGNPSATAYRAGSGTALQDAIQSIIGTTTATCTFLLTEPPANPELIQVTLGGDTLPFDDPVNGFTYFAGPPAQVTLGSTPCAEVESHAQQSLQFTELGQP